MISGSESRVKAMHPQVTALKRESGEQATVMETLLGRMERLTQIVNTVAPGVFLRHGEIKCDKLYMARYLYLIFRGQTWSERSANASANYGAFDC